MREKLIGLTLAFAVAVFSGSALADGDDAAAGGDPEVGEKVFGKWCVTCHSFDAEKKMQGPHLAGVFGRKSGTVDGFTYSTAMKEIGLVWDETTLDEYFKNPRGYIPGARMFFGGLPAESDRKNLIAYLKKMSAQASAMSDQEAAE